MGRKAYIKEASKELGLTEYQLRRMTKEGKVPFLRSGVKYIYDIELCEEFLKKLAIENIRSTEENNEKAYGKLRKVGVNLK